MKRITVYMMLLFWAGNLAAQSKSIDTTVQVMIGGIQQVIRLKGADSTKPLLLYLHGAGVSGYSLIDNGDRLTSELQKNFVVALWDQREYGKTYLLNKSPQPMTVDLIQRDAQEVTAWLLVRFGRQKLYLAGHSMGCLSGMSVAQQHPRWLYALVLMSPPVNGMESQRLELEVLKKHFKQVGNERAVSELATVKWPAKDFESLFIKFVWETEYNGEHIPDSVRDAIKPMLKQYMSTPLAVLSDEVFGIDFFKRYPAVDCPVYFFVGRKDLVTNAGISERYYKALTAPKKELFWFDASAHGIPDTETGKMQELIVKIAGEGPR